MLDLDQGIKKKLSNLFNKKKYSILELEIDLMGSVENQHSTILLLYAHSKRLNPNSKINDLIIASNLFEKVYLTGNKDNPSSGPYGLEPLINMILISFRTNEFKNVYKLALEAIKFNQKNEQLIASLSIISFMLANHEDAVKYYKLLFEVNPKRVLGRGPLLATLNYECSLTQEYYLAECLKYSKIMETVLIPNKIKQTHVKNKKIKIAFLSANLKAHSVSFFLKDLFMKIDKKIIEVIALSNLDKKNQDYMSEVVKNTVNQWHDIFDSSDTEVVDLIKHLNIDILIDLNGFTDGNRINVLNNRCAPVQICWLGYNNSTGLKNMDYLISDHNLIKRNEEKLYSEKILYLPKIWNALSKPKDLPQIGELPKKASKIFSYGSFNNFAKLSNDTIEVWSKILKNSNSQIYLKSSIRNGGLALKENILSKFIERGVSKDRVIFLEYVKNMNDHLELYNKVDVALDTFPYPGVTTSFEAVLMGVPVLTMKGKNFNSRCGESININLQMKSFIAKSKDDYFNKAISLQNKLDSLEMFRDKLRHKSLSSPLFDTDNFTKNFTKIIKEVCLKHSLN